jgi:uncharacterized protein
VPITPTYPGVYVEEIPSGVRTITGVSTSITAFVGYTGRGPFNKAVRIQSFAHFERIFGGLSRESDVSYAVQQFFANGGTDGYVVRTATGTGEATPALGHAANQGSLLVSGANEGAWANLVRLDVDYDTANPDSMFNVTATRFESWNGDEVPAEIEQHRNLSMNSGSGNYVENVINSTSRLIRVRRPDGVQFDEAGWSRSHALEASRQPVEPQDASDEETE